MQEHTAKLYRCTPVTEPGTLEPGRYLMVGPSGVMVPMELAEPTRPRDVAAALKAGQAHGVPGQWWSPAEVA